MSNTTPRYSIDLYALFDQEAPAQEEQPQTGLMPRPTGQQATPDAEQEGYSPYGFLPTMAELTDAVYPQGLSRATLPTRDRFSVQQDELNSYLTPLQQALQTQAIGATEIMRPQVRDYNTLGPGSSPLTSTRPMMNPDRETEEVEPVETTEETQGAGLMSRPLTGEERTALSDRGNEVNISRGYSIADEGGAFSSAKLSDALSKTIRSPVKKSLLDGMVEVEVGDAGPITETGYSRANVAAMSPTSAWGQRLVRDGLMTPDGSVTDAYSADAVFDSVYSNRMGNGDFASGDGSRFKGRGLVQITGRNTYQEVQNRLEAQGIDVDLMNNPSLVNDMRYALPAALAYLDYKGLDDDLAEGMTTKGLNNLINGGAPRATAERRWDAVIASLRASGLDDEADDMALRNEYAAQERVGTTVDGVIGRNSRTAMRAWLSSQGRAAPENASDIDLVKMVNSTPLEE